MNRVGHGFAMSRPRSLRLATAAVCAALMLAGCAQNGMGPLAGTSPGGAFSPPVPPSAPPPPSPPSARTFIYPARGQSPQQEQFDRGQCYSWAVQQSGFDPANPQMVTAPPPAPGPPEGGLFRGAAGGAALGAIGGAIGGNAGEGAAIGAGVGALFGVIRRARWAEEQQKQQQSHMAQQQNAMAQGHAAYNRAFSTCMTGRGYTVSM
jgi:OmpA family protein